MGSDKGVDGDNRKECPGEDIVTKEVQTSFDMLEHMYRKFVLINSSMGGGLPIAPAAAVIAVGTEAATISKAHPKQRELEFCERQGLQRIQ